MISIINNEKFNAMTMFSTYSKTPVELDMDEKQGSRKQDAKQLLNDDPMFRFYCRRFENALEGELVFNLENTTLITKTAKEVGRESLPKGSEAFQEVMTEMLHEKRKVET